MGKVEATLYLRYMWMFIDLATETVLAVFRFLTHPDDVLTFLTSHEAKQQIDMLRNKNILDKTAYEKATKELPNQFDLTLLITLIRNLMNEDKLKPPDKGWAHPPKGKDDSLAADLLRLRYIRNDMSHPSKAELEKHRFDWEWAKLTRILLRIQNKIEPKNEQKFKKKIEYYHREPIGPDTSQRISEQINEWKVIILEVQTKVDELLKVITDFDLYFNTPPNHRYGQYICLLDKGGRFVLSSYLKLKIEESGTELQEILRRNESTLQKEIKDRKQLALINTASTSNSVDRELNISSLAIVILHSLKNADEEIRQDVEYIKTAHETYAEIRVKTLDIDETLDDALLELKVSLKFVAKFLPKSQRDELNKITEECKHPENQQRQTALDNLKSEGIKTLKYVYNDIKEKTKTLLQKMTSENILFGSEKVLELKMITCGTSEEKTRLAERILIEVWQEALERTDNQERFTSIEEHVHNILNEIKKIKGITMTKIEQRCILISVSSTTPMALMDAVKYFESEPFLETMSKIMIEIGYHFDTVFRIHSCLTMESLYEILTCNKVAHENKANSARLLINVSTPESMMKVLSLPYNEQVTKSIKAIAESLSSRMNEKIQFDLCLDGLDNDFAQDGRDLSSSEESSDNEQPFEVDISLNDNVDERLHENESKSLNTEANLIVKDNKGIKGIESERDSTSTEYSIEKSMLKKRKRKVSEISSFRDDQTNQHTRRRRDCADTADYSRDKEFKIHFLLGILLDMSCMEEKQQKCTASESRRQFILSQIKVMVDAVQLNVSNVNRIFAAALGGSQGGATFDIIGTLKSNDICRPDPISDETVEHLFKCFEENGAGITRKWVDKKILRQSVFEHEAKLILTNLKSNHDFTRKFFNDFLHSSCHDWGAFGSFIQKMYVSIVSFYRQATSHEIREVVNRSMTHIEESLLMHMDVNNSSIYTISDAASSFHNCNKKSNPDAKHHDILSSLNPFIYGEKRMNPALNEVCSLFKTSLSILPNHQKILFVISDGCTSENVDAGSISRKLEEANVTVVCFFFSCLRSEDQNKYDDIKGNLEGCKKLLVELSSKFPQDLLFRAILMKRGIDIQTNDDKMFFDVKDLKQLNELCRFLGNTFSCRDSILDLVPFVSLDTIINKASLSVTMSPQSGKHSFVPAVATSICLSKHRICSDADDGPFIQDIYEEVRELLEKRKQSAQLQDILTIYQLHCRPVEITGAMKAVAAKRTVIAKLYLTVEELRIFKRFYEEKPFGVLTSDDMSLHRKSEDEIPTEHFVLLAGFNFECLRFMNFLGDTWADKGFFRVENGNVLKTEFFDVYWKDEENSTDISKHQNKVTENFEKELSRLQGKLVSCPSCESSIKAITLGGTLPSAECPFCMTTFSITEDDETLFALHTYLASLSR